MTSFSEIAKTATGALIVIWAVWTEWRLRQSQSDNAQLRRTLAKANIKNAVESESDDALRAELDNDVSGG
jgi:hypothetical protein